MNQIDISQIGLPQYINFVAWVVENKIGNWEYILENSLLLNKLSNTPVIFEFTDEERTLMELKWIF